MLYVTPSLLPITILLAIGVHTNRHPAEARWTLSPWIDCGKRICVIRRQRPCAIVVVCSVALTIRTGGYEDTSNEFITANRMPIAPSTTETQVKHIANSTSLTSGTSRGNCSDCNRPNVGRKVGVIEGDVVGKFAWVLWWGCLVGDVLGVVVAALLGLTLGTAEGGTLGTELGVSAGMQDRFVGSFVGLTLGDSTVGVTVGDTVGIWLGETLGAVDGSQLRTTVGTH